MPRKRRRKLPEGEAKLMNRIKHYESLLRDNNIRFEPYHPDDAGVGQPQSSVGGQMWEALPHEDSPTHLPRRSDMKEEGTRYEDFRSAVDRWFDESESAEAPSMHEDETDGHKQQSTTLRRMWNRQGTANNKILFGFRQLDLDLSVMHPNQVQIFRLWQIYLDNVNPMLKVTHTPSLQGQIIEAASDVSKIEPNLQALMFSIYSVSVMTLTEQQCQAQLGSSRTDLLTGYQMATQQALLNCDFLSTDSRNCLTALFLFLVSYCFTIHRRPAANALRCLLETKRWQIPERLHQCSALH
jgi:hypothetical protein